jgi:hypothetical protein
MVLAKNLGEEGTKKNWGAHDIWGRVTIIFERYLILKKCSY